MKKAADDEFTPTCATGPNNHLLKERAEMSKYRDIIADALRPYEAVVEDVLEGNEVLTRKDDGTEIPYRVIL